MNTNEYEIVYANGGLIELLRAAAADGVEVTSDDVETTINEMGTDAPYRDGEHRPRFHERAEWERVRSDIKASAVSEDHGAGVVYVTFNPDTDPDRAEAIRYWWRDTAENTWFHLND